MTAPITPPAYLQAGTYDAVKDRQYLVTARNYADTADASGARGGVLPAPAAWSFPASATLFAMVVGPGRAIVKNTFVTNGGDFEVISTAAKNLAITGSSPTTNRVDIVGVRVRDAFYSGAINDADIVVVQGTPSAGVPAVPALPASFEALYRLNVNVNVTTPTIVDMRHRTAPVGATVPIFANQLSQGGSYFGEKRIVPAAGALPAREMYWGEDAVWHGLTPFVLEFANYNLSYATVNRGIADLTVPDPGFPYRITLGGQVASAMDGNNGWNFTVYTPSTGGTVIGARAQVQIRDPDNSFTGDNTRAMSGTSAIRTGSTAMELWCERNFGAGTQGIVVTPETKVCVTVIPA